jgi:phosphonate transport system substrate-binding protein
MKRFYYILILAIVVGGLSGCSLPPAETPVPTEASNACVGPTITIGDISDNPAEVIADKRPLANYLAEHLAAFGIKCGKVLVPDTVDKLIAYIKNGEVDIYMDSMYPAFLVSDATGAKPILRRRRNCDDEYYSVIFTTIDSGITSIGDLPGHMIAMDRSYSTSGFALPANYLLDRGLNLVVKDSYDDLVAQDEVGVDYSLDDKNSLNLVLEGKVSAGVTDDWYFGKWDKEAPGRLVKLAETVSVPRQAVLVRSGLGVDLQNAIKDVLANAHLDPVGRSIIEQDAQTCKYDDTPDGIEAAFEQMREMHMKIKEIPGWQDAFLQGR